MLLYLSSQSTAREYILCLCYCCFFFLGGFITVTTANTATWELATKKKLQIICWSKQKRDTQFVYLHHSLRITKEGVIEVF